MINFNEVDKIVIGRGDRTDIKIADISVSRNHANICKDSQGRIYIEDNSSKFGTLAQVQAPLVLNEMMNYNFQIGRSTISINFNQEKSFMTRIKNSQFEPQQHCEFIRDPGSGSLIIKKQPREQPRPKEEI